MSLTLWVPGIRTTFLLSHPGSLHMFPFPGNGVPTSAHRGHSLPSLRPCSANAPSEKPPLATGHVHHGASPYTTYRDLHSKNEMSC